MLPHFSNQNVKLMVNDGFKIGFALSESGLLTLSFTLEEC